jgi:hypothetical protein
MFLETGETWRRKLPKINTSIMIIPVRAPNKVKGA